MEKIKNLLTVLIIGVALYVPIDILLLNPRLGLGVTQIEYVREEMRSLVTQLAAGGKLYDQKEQIKSVIVASVYYQSAVSGANARDTIVQHLQKRGWKVQSKSATEVVLCITQYNSSVAYAGTNERALIHISSNRFRKQVC
jgi:hypothetical protein